MQGRMKEHPLSMDEVMALLSTEPVGNFGVLSSNGFPYITPVHFVLLEKKIYIHGLCVGQKIEYLQKNPNVGFEVFRFNGLIQDPVSPCDTNTDYQSVIVMGTARLIVDEVLKVRVLNEIVKKYTPQHIGAIYPSAMLKSTGVIEIAPLVLTGKYFK